MEEHRLAGVVLADRDVVRFTATGCVSWSRSTRKLRRFTVWEWRRKDLKPPSNPGVEMLRGCIATLSLAAWKRSTRASTPRKSNISGSGSSAGTWNQFSWRGSQTCGDGVGGPAQSVAGPHVLVREDLGPLPAGELEARVESELQRWQQQYERSLIDRLFESSGELRAVLGVDDTLVGLQEGLTRVAVVVRGIEEQVRQCTNCGWTDGTTFHLCRLRRCSAPDWAPRRPAAACKRYKVPLEVIADDAGDRLRKAGGIVPC